MIKAFADQQAHMQAMMSQFQCPPPTPGLWYDDINFDDIDLSQVPVFHQPTCPGSSSQPPHPPQDHS